MIFVPLQDFFSDEAKSMYVRGLSYTIAPTNHALRRWATVWHKDGKIRFLDDEGREGLIRDAADNAAAAARAGISGVANVSDKETSGPLSNLKSRLWNHIKGWF